MQASSQHKHLCFPLRQGSTQNILPTHTHTQPIMHDAQNVLMHKPHTSSQKLPDNTKQLQCHHIHTVSKMLRLLPARMCVCMCVYCKSTLSSKLVLSFDGQVCTKWVSIGCHRSCYPLKTSRKRVGEKKTVFLTVFLKQ